MNLQIWRNYFSELIHGLWTKRRNKMYDINDDELKEMYESPGKSEIKLGKGISPADPIS